MQIAILTVASLSLVASAGTLLIMAKTAKELKDTKARVEADVETFKNKTDRNVQRIRNTINDLEL